MKALSSVGFKNLRFVIFDAPSDANAGEYASALAALDVLAVVRCCSPSYSASLLANITVHELPFADGDAPPSHVVDAFLALVDSNTAPLGIHCVAGLGRAPVLVAVALIEAGMAPLDAVIHIRAQRRGAINAKQLKFIEAYKRRQRKGRSKCALM